MKPAPIEELALDFIANSNTQPGVTLPYMLVLIPFACIVYFRPQSSIVPMHTINLPYTAADLATVVCRQEGNTLFIHHGRYRTRLTYRGPRDWNVRIVDAKPWRSWMERLRRFLASKTKGEPQPALDHTKPKDA